MQQLVNMYIYWECPCKSTLKRKTFGWTYPRAAAADIVHELTAFAIFMLQRRQADVKYAGLPEKHWLSVDLKTALCLCGSATVVEIESAT